MNFLVSEYDEQEFDQQECYGFLLRTPNSHNFSICRNNQEDAEPVRLPPIEPKIARGVSNTGDKAMALVHLDGEELVAGYRGNEEPLGSRSRRSRGGRRCRRRSCSAAAANFAAEEEEGVLGFWGFFAGEKFKPIKKFKSCCRPMRLRPSPQLSSGLGPCELRFHSSGLLQKMLN